MRAEVATAERTVGYGIVAGLAVSQANWALFEDLVNRQASFDAVGWANWFLYLLVPVLAGGVLLHRGLAPAGSGRRRTGMAVAASAVGLAVVSVVLRLVVPAILRRGDVLSPRLPRTLADGFTFVAEYARLAPLAGQGGRFDIVAAVVSAALMAATVTFGALAFRIRAEPLLASAIAGAALAGIGWFVPGGAGARIIGALWPPLFLGVIGAVVAFTTRERLGDSPA